MILCFFVSLLSAMFSFALGVNECCGFVNVYFSGGRNRHFVFTVFTFCFAVGLNRPFICFCFVLDMNGQSLAFVLDLLFA